MMRVSGVLVGLTVLLAACSFPGSNELSVVSPDSVALPSAVTAGDPIGVELDLPAAGNVQIVILTGGEAFDLSPTLPAGRSVWTVPAEVSRTAGRLTVIVANQSFDVTIAPAEPNDFTEVLVGPRTIVADGTDHSLAVVAPCDVYGNALPDRTQVEFERVATGGDGQSYERAVSRSLAWTRLTAGTLARENSVWATMDQITGVPATLNEVPGVAVAVELDLPTATVVADGRQVIELATTQLVDEFDNQLPDGIAGVFRLTTPTTTSLVPATVQRGRLRAFWTAPTEPGELSITASVNGQTSPSAQITAVAAVRPFETAGRFTPDGYRVDVGPILDPAGALVADGTEVTIGDVATTTSDGVASALVQAESGVVAVTVLGRTANHEVKP